MKASTERTIIRAFHLVGAAIIGTFVYAPWHDVQWFVLLNQAVVVPLLSLSGIWMWKGHRIKAFFNRSAQ